MYISSCVKYERLVFGIPVNYSDISIYRNNQFDTYHTRLDICISESVVGDGSSDVIPVDA